MTDFNFEPYDEVVVSNPRSRQYNWLGLVRDVTSYHVTVQFTGRHRQTTRAGNAITESFKHEDLKLVQKRKKLHTDWKPPVMPWEKK